jgi:hypothetical protein
MRKTTQALLLVILTAALFTACFSVGMAEEIGTKEINKQEEVKKKKQKAKRHKSGEKRKEAGEDKAKTSEDSRMISDVNKNGQKALDALHNGVENFKNVINEEYRKLKVGN